MNTVKRKMRSKSGATVILALVFLMFCLFLGGSVIAAGAANSFRTKQLSQQQDQLSARSAARLVAQELTAQDGTELQLTIVDVTKTIQPVTAAGDNSGTATVQQEILVRLPEGTELTGMQRLAMETAVWQFLRQSGITSTANITLENFPVSSAGEFWYQYNLSTGGEISGQVKLDAKLTGGGALDTTNAYFLNENGTGLYDFFVSVGEDGLVDVRMNAFYQSKEINSTLTTQYDNATGYAKITTCTNQTVILWGEPTVEKGG